MVGRQDIVDLITRKKLTDDYTSTFHEITNLRVFQKGGI